MGSKSKTLDDLLLHQLRDLHYAEKHGGKMLSKLAKAASAEAVKSALAALGQTSHDNVEALDALFDKLDRKSHTVPCEAMMGMVEEAKELLHDFDESDALDAGLLAAAQAIVSYGAVRCGSIRRWSAKLGLGETSLAMDALLAEKQRTLGALDRLAEDRPVPSSDEPTLTLKTAALSGLA